MTDLVFDIAALPSMPLTERAKLPSCAAVYLVVSDREEVLYIGQTRSLVFRWRSHHMLNQIDESCRITWMQTSEDNLRQLERDLINRLKPPYNNIRLNGVNPLKKVPVFLRLSPDLYRWLKDHVATGKYFNVQEKIINVLRDAQEADQSRAA